MNRPATRKARQTFRNDSADPQPTLNPKRFGKHWWRWAWLQPWVLTLVAIILYFLLSGGCPGPIPHSSFEDKIVAVANTFKPLTREQVRSRLEIPSPHYLSLGFNADVLNALEIGHSVKKNKTIIPVFDRGYVRRLPGAVRETLLSAHAKGSATTSRSDSVATARPAGESPAASPSNRFCTTSRRPCRPTTPLSC